MVPKRPLNKTLEELKHRVIVYKRPIAAVVAMAAVRVRHRAVGVAFGPSGARGVASSRPNAPSNDAVRRSESAGFYDIQGISHRSASLAGLAAPPQGHRRIRRPALRRSRRDRRDSHHGRDLGRSARRAQSSRGQHHHPAARQAKFSYPRKKVMAEAQGNSPRQTHRADVFEGRDPRALSEQGVFRRRPARRRGRGARVFRQVRGRPGSG